MSAGYYYHCGFYQGKTACGLETFDGGLVWDEPTVWAKTECSSRFSGSKRKCPACMESEDLPLFFLGDLP